MAYRFQEIRKDAMIPLDAFSPDYNTARHRFRSLAAERGWPLVSHSISAPGFTGGDLTIDSVRIGSPSAQRLLILSSGVHGAEGPFGSAVQTAWIDSLPKLWDPPKDCAIQLVHALNPFGYFHGRRWNEDNVDLNRNFLAPDQFAALREKSEKSLYSDLDPYLNPGTPPPRIDLFPIVASLLILRFGRERLRHTLPIGQYAFPRGLFYGGDRPSQTAQIVESQSPRWVGNAHQIIHLDFHTGLGEWGTYKLLLDARHGSPLEHDAWEFFGNQVETLDGPTAYESFGSFENALVPKFHDRKYLFLTAEFGTYSNIYVLKWLRRENRMWQWGDRSTNQYRQIRKQMDDTFVPPNPGWRWSVIRDSLRLIRSTIDSWT
jgi:hypothetical protein